MSQNTQSPEFRARCAQLWKAIAQYTTLDRFHEQITRREKSVFLGYADITLGVLGLFGWKIRGVPVKMLNGKPHLDMPSEKGADGKWYPITFPKNAETREVLTTFIFSRPEVAAAMANAEKVAVEQPAAGDEVGAYVDAGTPPANAGIPNPFEEAGA